MSASNSQLTLDPFRVVLAVDDSIDDAVLLQSACRKANVGFILQTVTDGQKAIEYLTGIGPYADRATYPLPHLLLLDLKMPRKSGFEVLCWLRQDPNWAKLPTIIFSSSQHEADVKKAYLNGADGYLLKPVGFHALIDLVRGIEQCLIPNGTGLATFGNSPLFRPAPITAQDR